MATDAWQDAAARGIDPSGAEAQALAVYADALA